MNLAEIAFGPLRAPHVVVRDGVPFPIECADLGHAIARDHDHPSVHATKQLFGILSEHQIPRYQRCARLEIALPAQRVEVIVHAVGGLDPDRRPDLS
jgi:hypothetical protein